MIRPVRWMRGPTEGEGVPVVEWPENWIAFEMSGLTVVGGVIKLDDHRCGMSMRRCGKWRDGAVTHSGIDFAMRAFEVWWIECEVMEGAEGKKTNPPASAD